MTSQYGKGDLLPVLQAHLVDANQSNLNLSTGGPWTVVFYMTTNTGALDTPVINGVSCTIVDAATGLVEYDWVSGDTNTAGQYVGRFKATNAASKTESFPNLTYITITITDNF